MGVTRIYELFNHEYSEQNSFFEKQRLEFVDGMK